MPSGTRGVPQAGLPHSLPRRIERLVSVLCRRMLPHSNEDLVEDCRQEVALLLWRIRERLEVLPDEQRQLYTHACVRRVVWRTVRAELQHRERVVPLEVVEPCRSAAGLHGEAAVWPRIPPMRGLLDCVGDPRLAAALKGLSDRDYYILHMHFVEELGDAETASSLGMSDVALRKHRSRILARLRQSVREVPACGLSNGFSAEPSDQAPGHASLSQSGVPDAFR